MKPDELEVVAGASREQLEGWIPNLATDEEIREALEKAFSYRGDVTITCKDGSRVEGYVFDRRTGRTLEESIVRVMPKDGSPRRVIRYSDISALVFSGKDTAAGKSWEAWVRKYWEKRAAGERNISLTPEPLE
ncbi:MAG: hypothetical protein IRZ15_01585 [Bryobacteraceae bacterium]|nr:hypothetical protein [Bryobacteraceae bacterium]